MPESLGMKLRSARESKGLSIDQLATITKINPAFINALENGRWDLLPGRVYLKTFTKLCAEALGLNVGELYGMIDGFSSEATKTEVVKQYETLPAEGAPLKKKTDFKLPIVAVIVLLLIAFASYFIKTRINPQNSGNTPASAIHTIIRTGPIQWERPWQKPAMDQASFILQRLRLETEAPVWVRVIADGDTAFMGVMPADSGHTFTAENGFLVSVGKNDRVRAFLNGIKVPALGASEGPLRNYPIGIKESKDNTGPEN